MKSQKIQTGGQVRNNSLYFTVEKIKSKLSQGHKDSVQNPNNTWIDLYVIFVSFYFCVIMPQLATMFF